MNIRERSIIIKNLRSQLNRIATELGHDPSGLQDDDIIPDSGLVDSTGLLEFVIWYDEFYALNLQPEEMTIDNLGSLARMASFVQNR